ncbi:MAG: carbon starvation CstA family protein [Armatimonadota bacterium]|nr:carbon starvation CstA family protein [Armatimonadota bacterium]MDR7451523.1 carbon starvation CstA family protein [Armatimonadota bacterium]MDR7467490.1 carbon starvation CstA family protein [Armatimonadota bacterium]MDR7494364.1 carbon starvation CstA family protein [Armatimonadota bacterium]MDR7499181.1 carbon starvation CstA family protein [Armatimonadota bacterium]
MAALMLVATIIIVWLGYRLYAARMDRLVLQPDPHRATPARLYQDGVDFMPASGSVLFGYQFKSIAALGPIVGPIVAAQWGWLPALLWLILGVLFIGWVQDYSSAMMAMRHEGLTMGGLSYKLISPRARNILLSFLYFYLLLIMGAFGSIVAGLMANPKVPIGFIIVTLAGVLAGHMTYRLKRDLVTTTIVTVVIAFVGVWLGQTGPLSRIVEWFNGLAGSTVVIADKEVKNVFYMTPYGPMTWGVWIWGILALVFCYLGSVLPIWRFAQPVNYVSFWLVIVGIVGSIVGILISWPGFGDFPAFTGFNAVGVLAPGVATPLWPILFVTIACGAISGWHSLVTTSGTSRQLEKETDTLPVTAGAMYTEAVLAVLALTFAVAGFGSFAGYKEVLARGGGAVFAGGMAKFLNVLGISTSFGAAFGSIFLCIMALTVMQLVLRFMRVASAELVGERFPAFRNPHFGSIVGILFTLLILWTGFWARIWILFGGSNQLFAGLALMLVSIWLANQGKTYRWVAYPAAFMYITTVAALLVTGWVSLQAAFKPGLAAAFVFGNLVAAIIAFALVILAVVLALDGVRSFSKAVVSLRRAPAG